MKNNARVLAITVLALAFILAFTPFASATGPYINLPPGTSDAVFYNYFLPDCYLEWIFTGVPNGYHVDDGTYKAWCVAEEYIYPGRHYGAAFYSSYDPLNPYPDPDWDIVNYILNNKHGATSYVPVQDAIWYFINGGALPGPGTLARTIVDDALANGEGFVPAPGQLMAVVCWIGSDNQTTFIEIVTPIPPVIPEVPFGTVVSFISMFTVLVGFVGVRRFRPKSN